MDLVVVGAALIHNGRVLAARRSAPADVAGGWEFPGGKVESGESDSDAVVRECLEELGVVVVAGAQIGGDVPLKPGYVLRVLSARLLDGAGEPQPLEDHDELRWLGADELDTVDWLDADRPFLAEVRELLGGEQNGSSAGAP